MTDNLAGLVLHEAATLGDYDSLEEYLSSGKYDVNLKDAEWGFRTPLHWACTKGYVECIRLLLEYGAKGTSRMVDGWTPAHCAAEAGKLTSLRALHTAHVPMNKTSKYGDTPKRIAEIYGFDDCVKYLEMAEQEDKERRVKHRLPDDDGNDTDPDTLEDMY
ncbi:ankyrin repeat domain-containing protein 66-like [Tubulanus polymorphus]|uniref:ankyrin repeat domain-containing protein 66-like n=1 Tax=Tubulanus polymorphus TaxID=672921 RepID=UPI003DA274A8